MKTILLSIVCLVACSVAFAKGDAAVPKVSCWLIYSKMDTGGATTDAITAEVGGSKVETHGFTLNAELERVCAADGGPCGGYRLTATVSKGEQSSYFSTALDPARKATRYTTGLTIGDESGFVNCDYETP
jgi:hypothetical protein